MDLVLSWLAGLLFVGLGAWAVRESVAWVRAARGERRERWAVRLALGLAVLAVVYAAGHLWLLAHRDALEEGRMWYARWGDPRLAEARRAEIRGWILDRSGTDEAAFARYESVDGSVERVYPAGEAGANLIGTREGVRDFVVDRLYARQLREPADWSEYGRMHPAGRDLTLTLDRPATEEAWRLLRTTGRPGAIVVQEAHTGAVVAYAATGGPEDAPLGVRQYAAPGSVFKIALAAAWWEADLGDPTIPCPGTIEVSPGARISNFGGADLGTVAGPHGMLVVSCNTAAVWMAERMREALGEDGLAAAYRRYGFFPYVEERPAGLDTLFWAAGDPWVRRMSPSPSRMRMAPGTSAFEWGLLSIGQGTVDVTVVQISRLLQAIANGGVMLHPTLEPERIGELARHVEEGRVLSEETAGRLQAAMLATVLRGTGRAAISPMAGTGWALGGKTGTAQVAGAPDDGWFAGLVHDEDGRPRYTVVVYLRGGGPGGAAPTLAAGELGAWLARNAAGHP